MVYWKYSWTVMVFDGKTMMLNYTIFTWYLKEHHKHGIPSQNVVWPYCGIVVILGGNTVVH